MQAGGVIAGADTEGGWESNHNQFLPYMVLLRPNMVKIDSKYPLYPPLNCDIKSKEWLPGHTVLYWQLWSILSTFVTDTVYQNSICFKNSLHVNFSVMFLKHMHVYDFAILFLVWMFYSSEIQCWFLFLFHWALKAYTVDTCMIVHALAYHKYLIAFILYLKCLFYTKHHVSVGRVSISQTCHYTKLKLKIHKHVLVNWFDLYIMSRFANHLKIRHFCKTYKPYFIRW